MNIHPKYLHRRFPTMAHPFPIPPPHVSTLGLPLSSYPYSVSCKTLVFQGGCSYPQFVSARLFKKFCAHASGADEVSSVRPNNPIVIDHASVLPLRDGVRFHRMVLWSKKLRSLSLTRRRCQQRENAGSYAALHEQHTPVMPSGWLR